MHQIDVACRWSSALSGTSDVQSCIAAQEEQYSAKLWSSHGPVSLADSQYTKERILKPHFSQLPDFFIPFSYGYQSKAGKEDEYFDFQNINIFYL